VSADELCWQVLGYESWLPWTGTFVRETLEELLWVNTRNQAMARCAYRFTWGGEGVPCSLLAQRLADGEPRCNEHALYW
jgi:hypothetical protein